MSNLSTWTRFRRSVTLRAWAFRQFIYDVRTEGGKDFRTSFREFILRTFVTGHLNCLPFIGCAEEEYPQLYRSPVIPVGTLLAVAEDSLRSYERLGLERGGFYPGYARAQLEHLGRCGRCKDLACESIREYVDLAQKTDALLRRAGLLDLN